MLLLESLRPLFANKLTQDDRDPIRIFEIPGMEGMFGLYAPQLEPIKQLLLVRYKRNDERR